MTEQKSHEQECSDEYEVTWKSGHIDTFRASQISWPNAARRAGIFFDADPSAPNIVCFHDSIDGKWTLILRANEDDIEAIRNLTRAPNRVLGGSKE